MNNAAYWKKRFRQLESARHASDGKKYLECEELFTAAMRELNELINAWFGRFARNNGVTLEDARKLLTSSELAELKWDVKQYIKAGEANALTGEFEKQLENAAAKYHISRLEAIKLQVQMECEKLYGNLTDEIDDHIRSQYLDAYYHTAYEIDRGFGVGHTLEAISTDKLESIVSKPWAADGKNFATRLGESKVKLINNVHASLTQMCMNGNNPDKAIAQLAKTMNGDKVRAGRIIMTESAYFAQEAQRKCFSELGVEEYEIVATLDNRTCDGTCQGEDGKHYPMKMFEAGVTAPPFHPNCRCCTAPYFDDDEGERIAKDADGKNYTVSSDMTYLQWKKEFVKDSKNVKERRLKDKYETLVTYDFAGKGTIKPKNIFKNLQKNDYGKSIWNCIQENNIPVQLEYGTAFPEECVAIFDPIDGVIRIDCSSLKTVQEVSEALCHEVTHFKLRNSDQSPFDEEIECFKAEYLFKQGYLTDDDINDIIHYVKKAYPDLL